MPCSMAAIKLHLSDERSWKHLTARSSWLSNDVFRRLLLECDCHNVALPFNGDWYTVSFLDDNNCRRYPAQSYIRWKGPAASEDTMKPIHHVFKYVSDLLLRLFDRKNNPRSLVEKGCEILYL